MYQDLPWTLPAPFVCEWTIDQSQIDHYQHANNVAYVAQLEKTAWAHSNHLGLSIEQYRALDRGMAISKHTIEYLSAAHLDDKIACATWIVHCDERLKLSRQFQFIRVADRVTVLRAQTDFVCISLSSGKPKKMPAEYASAYGAVVVSPQGKSQ